MPNPQSLEELEPGTEEYSLKLYKKNLRLRKRTIEEFLSSMYTIDIDIRTYINPEICQYRELFLKINHDKVVEETQIEGRP